jgi:GNAT superfamily N-acetyltransferase
VTLADRVAGDYADRLRSFGERAPWRSTAEVEGLTVVSLGVDEPWGTQVVAIGPPAVDALAVAAAVAWCRARGSEPQVMVRARDRDTLPTYAVADELVALTAPADATQERLEVSPAWDLAEFRWVYSASFGMRPGLAESLVVAADLEAVPHLLGRVDGRAVACAQVRAGHDLAYVSAVGVLPAYRSRGYGAAMLAACRAHAGGLGCELVWLNAAPRTAPFYEGIGFDAVDTHVALTSD